MLNTNNSCQTTELQSIAIDSQLYLGWNSIKEGHNCCRMCWERFSFEGFALGFYSFEIGMKPIRKKEDEDSTIPCLKVFASWTPRWSERFLSRSLWQSFILVNIFLHRIIQVLRDDCSVPTTWKATVEENSMRQFWETSLFWQERLVLQYNTNKCEQFENYLVNIHHK